MQLLLKGKTMDNDNCSSCNEDAYEENLNEIYGNILVCGFSHPSGTLLKEIDPTAFRVGMADEECTCEEDEDEEEEEDENDSEEVTNDINFG